MYVTYNACNISFIQSKHRGLLCRGVSWLQSYRLFKGRLLGDVGFRHLVSLLLMMTVLLLPLLLTVSRSPLTFLSSLILCRSFLTFFYMLSFCLMFPGLLMFDSATV